METTMKFEIKITFDEITERTLWCGNCSWDKFNWKIHDIIMARFEEYKVNPQRCIIRGYDEFGQIIAQETFHGVQ